ncbi:hypothetical protein [Jannaschia formosa]|uniref:hypothetical protein n=1 Tax=Jannaschia formosa TaxID=2259592 RepID=UPI000E1C3F1C|nr:hypothetical protein [Jannaschia formosa]TFL18785.1 hypothetical protein DR046_07630 [Jannaschia formosa]
MKPLLTVSPLQAGERVLTTVPDGFAIAGKAHRPGRVYELVAEGETAEDRSGATPDPAAVKCAGTCLAATRLCDGSDTAPCPEG